MLHSDIPCLAPIGNWVDDISLTCQFFPFCQFSFVKAMCNKAAQALAVEALSSNYSQVWFEDYHVMYSLIWFIIKAIVSYKKKKKKKVSLVFLF
jgi:hypothetical protein